MVFNKISNFEPLVIISNAISGGGAEKSMMYLHQQFLNSGINSFLIALNKSEPAGSMLNIKILNRTWDEGITSTILNYFEFKKLFKQIDPKTVIANCELPELYIALQSTKNRRIICVEHTTKPWRNKIFIGLSVRIILKMKKVHWVTVVSDKPKIWLGKANPTYIPNPYIVENHKSNNHKPCLVYIGGLKSSKQPEMVIKAGIKNNISVHMYGEGPLKTLLKEKYNGELCSITFHGFNSKVWSQISRKSLIIVPSDFEGDGLVVVEAAIQKFALLIRDTKDFKRFAFESKHYFGTLSQLNTIISNNLADSFENLVVNEQSRLNLLVDRDLKQVALKWEEFLQFVSTHSK